MFDFGSFHYAISPLENDTGNSQAFGMAFEFGFSTLDFAFGASDKNDQQTAGLKFSQEFPILTLNVSLGADADGKATGFEEAVGLSLDAFVGGAGLLSFGIGALTTPTGEEERAHLSFNYEIDAFQIIASTGLQSAVNDTSFAELGVKYTF